MRDVTLKICGLTDPDTAAQAVELGVEYIGLVFHSPSRRHVEMDVAMSIAAAVHAKKGKIVPVFVNQAADVILDTALKLGADLIQLHGHVAIQSYLDIRDHYACIIAENLCDDIMALNPERDFLLYDYAVPGSGNVFDWQSVTPHKAFRSFIAGGINVHNIKQAIAHFHPFALDVSSGVENDQGIKDLRLISELVDVIYEGKCS